MSIDAQVRDRQRKAVQRRQPAILRLLRPPKPPLCECGRCRRCTKREWQRLYRLREPDAEPLRRGPRLDPERRCTECRGPIALWNRSGYCNYCSKHVFRARRVGATARKSGYYSHGGGI